MSQKRYDGRSVNQIRPLSLKYDTYGYADASVLFEQGNTKVLVTVSLQPNVPPFLKGQKVGWLSAEYAMLPNATHQRTQREATQNKRNARGVEISRLIGRCLRPTLDLASLGERSIFVDCDVLQADGGTRVACITAASIALKRAAQRWFEKKMTIKNIYLEQIAAISVGIVGGVACTDLCYEEDAQAEADFNFVLTQNGNLIEIQGTSETQPISWNFFDELKQMACDGVIQIFNQLETQTGGNTNAPHFGYISTPQQNNKQALFSLANRFNKL